MDPAITSHTLPSPKGPLHYLSAGPSSGPLLIFIHGWPGLALCWRPQLLHFSRLGYHCVAMDMLGYGKSPAPTDTSEYSCEATVADQLLLLSHLQQPSAVWIGHDWGCGPLWTLASHHPELCTAIISICIPYRTLELGLDTLLQTVNRTIYPADTYPWGPWDYQVFYERRGDDATRQFAAHSDKAIKLLYSRGNPAALDKPARTSRVTVNESWFGPDPPDIPLTATVLDESLYAALVEGLGRNGWHGATAWYLNHAANAKYNNASGKDAPRLEMPVLYIDARLDVVCGLGQSPLLPKEMRRLCADLTERCVEAGHWANLERPEEVNRYVEEFLGEKKNAVLGKKGEEGKL